VASGITTVAVEASGLCYLPDVGLFAVVSDETERKKPDLYLMDTSGAIGSKATVKKVSSINDIEAITADPRGRIYLLSSQSHNRKGNLTAERKLLVRLERKGTDFSADASVSLIDLLSAAAQAAPKEEWAVFVNRAVREKTADIEGVAWFNDTLLLGFKNPRLGNDAIILGIDDPDAMFDRQTLAPDRVRLWRHQTVFDTVTGTYCGISDLCCVDGTIYGLSTGVHSRSGVDENTGLFWCYQPETGAFEVLRNFPGLKPEGIAWNTGNGMFYVTFDNGAKNFSQLMTAKVSP
jgi:hypothetical protein